MEYTIILKSGIEIPISEEDKSYLIKEMQSSGFNPKNHWFIIPEEEGGIEDIKEINNKGVRAFINFESIEAIVKRELKVVEVKLPANLNHLFSDGKKD